MPTIASAALGVGSTATENLILNVRQGKMNGTSQHRNLGSPTRSTKVAKEARVARAKARVVLMECVAERKILECATSFRSQENADLAQIASMNMYLPPK